LKRTEIRRSKSERPVLRSRPDVALTRVVATAEGGRPKSEIRMLFGLSVTAVFLYLPFTMMADTNLLEPKDIPQLQPPRGELPPTFWEQHGLAVSVGIVIALVLVALAVWFLTRPRPPIVVAPSVLARQALERLKGQPENGAVLSRVSQIMRRYMAGAFELEPGELTTSEFCRTLAKHEKVGAELASAIGDFLRRCDEHKFKPANLAPAGPLRAVESALQLIDQAEARLERLRQESAQVAGDVSGRGASPNSIAKAQ
jgi:Domain of unknown function (DUF4381)